MANRAIYGAAGMRPERWAAAQAITESVALAQRHRTATSG